jgi:tRNA U54 and U55 pseudouridine synthase Pus10
MLEEALSGITVPLKRFFASSVSKVRMLKKDRHFVLTQGKSQPRKKKLVAAVDNFDEEVIKDLCTVSVLHSNRGRY